MSRLRCAIAIRPVGAERDVEPLAFAEEDQAVAWLYRAGFSFWGREAPLDDGRLVELWHRCDPGVPYAEVRLEGLAK